MGYAGGATNFFPQFFSIYPYGNYLVILYIVFMVYGVIRYKLLSAKVSDLADSYVSYNSIQQWQRIGKEKNIEALSEKVWRIRAFGDFLSYMYVAEGAIDAASEPDLSYATQNNRPNFQRPKAQA